MKPRIVGITGHPSEEVLAPLWADPSVEIADLDIPAKDVSISRADPLMPRVCCAVLRTIVANALARRPGLIVADVGEGKCDGMRLVAEILENEGFSVQRTRNMNLRGGGTPISVSSLPLAEKLDRITARLSTGKRETPPPARAVAGYWGVPPADFSILELFPENTHVFGWTRCMENGTPADLALEMQVDPNLPTVFFAQSFCAKNLIARDLALRHNGMCVDAAERCSHADRAKIEAFFAFNLPKGYRAP